MAAAGLSAQLALLWATSALDAKRALTLASLLGVALGGMLLLEPSRLRTELAFYAAVGGLGGFGMLAGGLAGAATAGMLVGCLGACLWVCRLDAPCARARDWRHHTLGLLLMACGMVAGGMLLVGWFLAWLGDAAAGHLAMVIGMVAGTAAGICAIDALDDRRRGARGRHELRLAAGDLLEGEDMR